MRRTKGFDNGAARTSDGTNQADSRVFRNIQVPSDSNGRGRCVTQSLSKLNWIMAITFAGHPCYKFAAGFMAPLDSKGKDGPFGPFMAPLPSVYAAPLPAVPTFSRIPFTTRSMRYRCAERFAMPKSA